MAKQTGRNGSKDKETIVPPSGKASSAGSKAMKAGSPAGARVMADASVAKRQGVKRPTKPK